jgi:hypothetical protein
MFPFCQSIMVSYHMLLLRIGTVNLRSSIVGQAAVNAHGIGALWTARAGLRSKTAPSIAAINWIRSAHGEDSKDNSGRISNWS